MLEHIIGNVIIYAKNIRNRSVKPTEIFTKINFFEHLVQDFLILYLRIFGHDFCIQSLKVIVIVLIIKKGWGIDLYFLIVRVFLRSLCILRFFLKRKPVF